MYVFVQFHLISGHSVAEVYFFMTRSQSIDPVKTVPTGKDFIK
jgi:hypothetical protein